MQGMCPGEQRRLIVPPELGYGEQGKGTGRMASLHCHFKCIVRWVLDSHNCHEKDCEERKEEGSWARRDKGGKIEPSNLIYGNIFRGRIIKIWTR